MSTQNNRDQDFYSRKDSLMNNKSYNNQIDQQTVKIYMGRYDQLNKFLDKLGPKSHSSQTLKKGEKSQQNLSLQNSSQMFGRFNQKETIEKYLMDSPPTRFKAQQDYENGLENEDLLNINEDEEQESGDMSQILSNNRDQNSLRGFQKSAKSNRSQNKGQQKSNLTKPFQIQNPTAVIDHQIQEFKRKQTLHISPLKDQNLFQIQSQMPGFNLMNRVNSQATLKSPKNQQKSQVLNFNGQTIQHLNIQENHDIFNLDLQQENYQELESPDYKYKPYTFNQQNRNQDAFTQKDQERSIPFQEQESQEMQINLQQMENYGNQMALQNQDNSTMIGKFVYHESSSSQENTLRAKNDDKFQQLQHNDPNSIRLKKFQQNQAHLFKFDREFQQKQTNNEVVQLQNQFQDGGNFRVISSPLHSKLRKNQLVQNTQLGLQNINSLQKNPNKILIYFQYIIQHNRTSMKKTLNILINYYVILNYPKRLVDIVSSRFIFQKPQVTQRNFRRTICQLIAIRILLITLRLTGQLAQSKI